MRSDPDASGSPQEVRRAEPREKDASSKQTGETIAIEFRCGKFCRYSGVPLGGATGLQAGILHRDRGFPVPRRGDGGLCYFLRGATSANLALRQFSPLPRTDLGHSG